MMLAPDSLDTYCPDLVSHSRRTRALLTPPPEPGPTEPTLSVVLGRVVALLVSVAIAVALWAGATQYGGWHPALAGVAAGVIFAATHDTLSAKVK